MSSRIPLAPEDWFMKSFTFDHPVGAFPALIERLRGTPARLEELTRALPADILTTRIGESWSIQEHVGHLYDLEELHEGRLDDFEAGLEVLRAADMTNRKTEEARHNDANLSDLLASFRAVRTKFLSHLESMGEAATTRSALHPRLQKQMKPVDLVFFVAEHDDHHVAALARLSNSAAS